jgi:phage repressor protein C with HTH and peptisase S24 domain
MSMPHYYIRIVLFQYLCNDVYYYNRDMNSLRERLIWARTKKTERDGSEFTQQDLADKAGVTQGNIAHLESGRSKTSRNLTKIAAALGVSPEWLADGKGAALQQAHPQPETYSAPEIPGAYRVAASNPDHASRVKIRKVADLRLSAGITGFQVELDPRDHGVWEVPARWLQRKGYDADALLAMEVKGESMEPNLYDGDLVVINTAETGLVSGEVYAINYEGEAVIKRMVREGGQWYLCSDNPSPRYGRRNCKGSECIMIGRVVRRETDYV